MKSFYFSKFILFIFILFFSSSSLLRAASPEILKKVSSLIKQTKNENPKDRSQAAVGLKPFVYSEVKEALLDLVSHELKQSRPNAYVISAAIESLEDQVSRPDMARIKEIEQEISANQHDFVKQLSSEMKTLKKHAHQREHVLPSLDPNNSLTPDSTFNLPSGSSSSDEEDPLKTLQKGTERDLTKFVKEQSENKNAPQIVGREKEVTSVLDVLVRLRNRVPVLVGSAGVGKTAVAQKVALTIGQQSFSDWDIYKQEFPETTVVLETSPARISRIAKANDPSAQAAAVEQYFDALIKIQKQSKRKIVLFLDNIHTFTATQINALKNYVERLDGVSIIGASTPSGFLKMISEDPAIRNQTKTILISEFDAATTKEVLQQGWIPALEERYHIVFAPNEIERLLNLAEDYQADLSSPDREIRFLQDLAIHFARKAKGDLVEIEEKKAREFLGEKTGISVNPNDTASLVKYLETGKQKILENVIGQEQILDTLMEVVETILTSRSKKAARTVMILGSTGTGKTLSAEKVAEQFFSGKKLVLDGSSFQSGEASLNSAFGSPPGLKDKSKGSIAEFLSGPGKDSGVIIINEFDKAHSDFAKRLMETLDRKEFIGSDGTSYPLGRHLFVLTSNRGVKQIFDPQLIGDLEEEEMNRYVGSVSEATMRKLFTSSYSVSDENILPPEMVGRIDRWAVAKPLQTKQALLIAKLELAKLDKENKLSKGFEIKFSDTLISELVGMAFSTAEGARPVNQQMERRYVEVRSKLWRMTDSLQGRTFLIDSVRNGKNEILVTATESGKEVFHYTIKDPGQFMAIHNPAFIEKLKELENNIKKEYFGQDEAIEEIVRAVQAKAFRPFDPSPVSVWLLGGKGTGKTGTARALAKHLFGSEKRAFVISFGGINHPFDLGNIFNPPKSVTGGGDIGPFKKIVSQYEKEGAVIVMDELSNMGSAASPQVKEGLFKFFYDIFIEGTWTDNQGKAWDLSKIVFVLTGNDGDHLLRNLSNDKIRQRVWDENKSRRSLTQILASKSVPEPFVDRIQSLILMKPLTENLKISILNKFVSKIAAQYKKTYNLNVEFTDAFYQKASALAFSVDEGAREAERFAKKDLSAFISSYLMRHSDKLFSKDEKHIVVDLVYNETTPDQKPKLILKQAGNSILEKEFNPAVNQTQMDHNELEGSALHEAAITVTNEILHQPLGNPEWISIEPKEDKRPQSFFKKGATTFNKRILENRLIALASGLAILEINQIELDLKWKADSVDLVEAATKLKELEDLEGLIKGSKTRTVKNIIRQSFIKAKELLKTNTAKEKIEKLKAILIEKKSMNEAEIKQWAEEEKIDCSRALKKE